MISYAASNRGFLAEKLISVGFALSAVLLCVPNTVFYGYVVMGYSHIVLAIVYLAKAGRLSLLKALSYPFLMAALFYTGFHFPRELTLLTGFLLMYHVYAGEVKFI
ncbi:MAG TPA: hypothetical protein VL625_12630, partial [Patescibacteria group bacterium]|nr:hypothetical protein [Patescibacteria group bacterium]